MIKSYFFKNPLYYSMLIFQVLLFSGFRILETLPVEIVLRDERLQVTPKEFYIADVVDARESRNGIGWLVPVISTKKNGLYPIDLHGGGLIAIKQFISHSLQQNVRLRPVIIKLKKVNVAESDIAGGKVEGKVHVVMSFGLEQPGNDTLELVGYNGKANYIRSVATAQDVEPMLRHVIANGLVYLNTWMDQQAGKNIKLAKKVKVYFTDYHDSSGVEGDSVYYNTRRPLNWNDFQSKVYSSRYDAEVFPVIGYDEHADISNGIINLRLEMKVCLPKSACWVKSGSRNDYALNHEQRHFDIVKIIAERFKLKILQEQLPVNNFDGPLNVDYLEAIREMNRMQKQYDSETVHGTDPSAQEEWNNKIDNELIGFRIK